jgi:hypothetical protein
MTCCGLQEHRIIEYTATQGKKQSQRSSQDVDVSHCPTIHALIKQLLLQDGVTVSNATILNMTMAPGNRFLLVESESEQGLASSKKSSWEEFLLLYG